MLEHDDPRIKAMMKVLAETIGQTFSDSPEIKEALREIEGEGYHVDIILASVARISRKDSESPSAPLTFNEFDRTFLETIRVRLDDQDEDLDDEEC